MVDKSLFSSASDEWTTPQDLFDTLNDEFKFELDPCATKDNYKCKNYFTIEDDGLSRDWAPHRTFVNPPYSQIKLWMKKCYEESLKGALVVALIPSRTDTQYFHDWIYYKAELRFIKGRLKFGDSKNSAPFPSMIVIWR